MAKTGTTAKTLQYLMGHSDVAATLNVYTHIGVENTRLNEKLNSSLD